MTRPTPTDARVRRVVALVVLAALLPAAVTARGLASGLPHLWVAIPLAALVLSCRVWPMVLYRGSGSEAITVDEGAFALAVVLLTPGETAAMFAAAAALAQLLRGRSLVKSVFNVSWVLIAACSGAEVTHALLGSQPRPGLSLSGAAAMGVLTFFLVNKLLVSWVLAASGAMPFGALLRDFSGSYLLVVLATTLTGLVGGSLLTAPSAAVIGIVPLVVLRLLLAGLVKAHRDRQRLTGLFEATREISDLSRADEVMAAMVGQAGFLLRCPTVQLLDAPPDTAAEVSVSRRLGRRARATALAARVEDGTGLRWLTVSGRPRTEPFDAADGSLLAALVAVGSAALQRAETHEQSRRERERLDAVTSSLAEAVVAVDGHGELTFANPAAVSLLGLTSLDGRSPSLPDAVRQAAEQALATRRVTAEQEATLALADRTAVPVSQTAAPILDGQTVVGAVVAVREITERRAFEQRLAHQAFHDDLTGLPNRRIFLDRLEHAMRRSQRSGEGHAVLFLDVDRFKVANDNLGHQAGDELLVVIADRLRALMRPGDTLARFGGDEFTLLLENVRGVEDAESLAVRIGEALRRPVRFAGGREVVTSLSVGIALTRDQPGPDDVLHDADIAMYQAKRRGPGRYVVFDKSAMSGRSSARVDLEADLRRAIDNGELVVHYQPVVDTQTRRILGCEALVRWQSPTRGLLGPGEFIEVAEDTGLVLPLGRQVLAQACHQAKIWTDQTGTPFSMSVNLSARQFSDPRLVGDITGALTLCGLSPSQLCLEITETVAIADTERTLDILTELKGLGVRLAMDDFGVGYSSLRYLKRFPMDIVKVDQAFVSGLVHDPVDAAIVSAVMALARAVGMETVAEGVETEEQLFRLQDLGCPYVQGYFLSRPLPAAGLTARLQEQTLVLPPAQRLALVRP